jgi:hypothetical protein
VNERLPTILGKAMEMHVLLAIAKCAIITCSFDLWMSRFVLKKISSHQFDYEEWILCYVTRIDYIYSLV